MSDFLIIGAGINGLLLARELAASNADIMLVDKGRCGMEASWAGGGIVSPLYPWRYQSAVTVLANWAQDFYPQLVEELIDETGIDPELNRSGLLMLAAEDADLALQWAQRHDRKMQRVDADILYRQEPGLAPGFESGLWMPEVTNVRNPRLIQALCASLQAQSNVQILERCQVQGFSIEENRINGVTICFENQQKQLSPSVIVICGGAWSGQLLEQVGLSIVIEPVKGQMLLFKLEQPPIKSILLTAGRYLIPRIDGHVLVGSTLEHVGFNKMITTGARDSLLQSAFKILPGLREFQPVKQWAGLRPYAPNGIPYIGNVEKFENLFVNAGQYRNGLLLAPASARLLADSLLGRKPIVDPMPYLPRNRRQDMTDVASTSTKVKL